MLAAAENRIRRWLFGRDLAVWYAPEYRLPLSAVEARTGFEPRRADHALWFLLERRAIGRRDLRPPGRARPPIPGAPPTPSGSSSSAAPSAAGTCARRGAPSTTSLPASTPRTIST